MTHDTSMALVQSIIDSQKEMIVLFYEDEVFLINRAFQKFVSVASLQEYKEEFGAFVNNFVPHPSYFNANKIEEGDTWFDSIIKLDEVDRVVSMLTPTYDPHAFSVDIDDGVLGYKIVTFTDITQTLIKRIMIENNANMDIRSGAYAKKYFLQIAQSYQDAALFNEKIIGAILIKVESANEEELATFATEFKNITRQDDMLVRWNDNSFLLVYLSDNVDNAQKMLDKLYNVSGADYTLLIQQENESIKELIARVRN